MVFFLQNAYVCWQGHFLIFFPNFLTARWWKCWNEGVARVSKKIGKISETINQSILLQDIWKSLGVEMVLRWCWDSVSASPPKKTPFACRVLGWRLLGMRCVRYLTNRSGAQNTAKPYAPWPWIFELNAWLKGNGVMICRDNEVNIFVYLHTYRFIDIYVLFQNLHVLYTDMYADTLGTFSQKGSRKDAISIVIHYKVFQHSTSKKSMIWWHL